MQKFITWVNKVYSAYCAQDTTGWIISKFIAEISEILLQSNALLFYNGYDIFDPNRKNHIHQANKPHFIKLFAGIFAFNAFGSGILWFLYGMLPNYCYGLLFKRCLFFVDKFSDFLYTIFPFIILIEDDYNANTNNFLILLAQLNIQSPLSFLAVYFPLFLICCKFLMITITTTYKMRKMYFEEWRKHIESILSCVQPTVNVDSSPKHSEPTQAVIDKPRAPTSIIRECDQTWLRKNTSNMYSKNTIFLIKKTIVILLACTLTVYGTSIIVYVTEHMNIQNTFVVWFKKQNILWMEYSLITMIH